MNKLILALLFLLPMSANAQFSGWSPTDKALFATSTALLVADWGQTRYIARHPDRFRELNPLLPEHPSLGDVNRHFLVSTAVMLAAAHYLPQYRKAMLQVWVAVGVIGTARNAHIGVRFDF